MVEEVQLTSEEEETVLRLRAIRANLAAWAEEARVWTSRCAHRVVDVTRPYPTELVCTCAVCGQVVQILSGSVEAEVQFVGRHERSALPPLLCPYC